jgi:hypothetical protein
VKISAPLAGVGLENWKMVKGTAYTGCAGGWKIAGTGHIDMHMTARVSKWSFFNTTTYTRSLPFHVETAKALAENIGSIVVKHPGLFVYSGNPAAPVGAATPITLLISQKYRQH